MSWQDKTHADEDCAEFAELPDRNDRNKAKHNIFVDKTQDICEDILDVLYADKVNISVG
jgi:hypothetical protein